MVVNILPEPLSASKSYAQDSEDSDVTVILGGEKYGKMTIDGSVLEVEIIPVDIFGQKKTDNDDDQRLEARMVYVMNINNETTGILPYSDETFADRWDQDEDGRWFADIALVREGEDVQFTPSPIDGEGMVPILVAGYYQFEVEVVKFDVMDPSLVLERTPIGEDGVAPVSPYKFFANPGQSSGSETSLSFGDDEEEATEARRRLLFVQENNSAPPASAEFLASTGLSTNGVSYKPDSSYDLSVIAGKERSLSVGLSDAFGNAQLFDELRRLDSLVVKLGETLKNTSSICAWEKSYFEIGQHNVDNEASQKGCTLLHKAWNSPFNDSAIMSPDYSEDGLKMSAVNNIDTGSFTISFTPGSQLPAIPYGAYQMDIVLNGQHIGASPYRFRVLPGPIFGPKCEIFGLKDTYQVNKTIEVGIIARDQFGNNQTSSDDATSFVVEAYVSKKNVFGIPVLVRGCTQNTGDSCSFAIHVASIDSTGLYVVSMLTTVASEYSLDGSEDHKLEVKYCPNPSMCSQMLNVYNPEGRDSATGAFLPYSMRIEPGPTDAASSIAYGTSLIEGGLIDEPANFTIEARDVFGNRRFGGGDNFQVLIYQPPPRDQLPVQAIEDTGDGRYHVSFLPTYGGRYSIVILFGINSVANSPYMPIFVSNHDKLSASQTRIVNEYGSLLVLLPPAVAAEDYDINIQAYSRDSFYSFSYPKTSGGEILTATLTPPSNSGSPSSAANVTIVPEGTHPGRYVAMIPGRDLQKSGTYKLIVKACDGGNATMTTAMPTVSDFQMMGYTGSSVQSCASGQVPKAILHSPFMIFVHSSVPDPANTFAVEFANPDALVNHGNGWRVGEVSSFTVQVRDRFKNNHDVNPASGNLISLVSLDIEMLKLFDADAVEFPEVFVQDTSQLGNDEFYIQYTGSSGRFIVFLKTLSAGQYSFDVSLLGQRVKNGAATIPIDPAAFDITNSYIESDVTEIPVGQSYAFFIRARDVYGNPLIRGGDNFLVDLTSDSPILDQGIGDNPLNAIAEAQLPEAGITSLAKEGKYTYSDGFSVQARVSIADLNDGSYRVLVRCDRAGTALMIISMYGDADGLPGICGTTEANTLCGENALVTNPALGIIRITFPAGNPTATESVAINSFGSLQQASAGTLTQFRLNARDKFRNGQSLPGFNFEVRLKSSDGSSDVIGNVYHSDVVTALGPAGIYIGEYTSVMAGNYSLSVRRAGKELKGSIGGVVSRGPFTPFTIFPGSTSGSTTVAIHEQLPTGDKFVAIAGETTNFTLVTKDGFANPKTVGGEEFVINVGPLAQGLSVDLGNGTYSASYRVTGSGDYKLAILVNNQLVQNPPPFYDSAEGGFKLNVKASDTKASLSEVVGVGLTTATSGMLSSFSLQTYDEFGNKKDFGGDNIIATLKSSDTGEVHDLNVTDNQDGTYDVDYTLYWSGIYTLALGLKAEGNDTVDVFYQSLTIPEDNPPSVVQIDPSTLSLTETKVKVDESMTFAFDTQEFEIIPKDNYGNLITKVSASDFSVMVSTGIAPEGDVFNFIRTEAYPAISEENGFFKSSIEVNSPGEYVVNVQFGTTLLGNPYIFKVIPAQVGISNAPADHHHACLSTECTVLDIQAFEGELFNLAFIGANDRMGRENPDYKLSIRVRDIYGNDLSDSVGSVDGVEGLEGYAGCQDASTAACPFRVIVSRPDGLRMSSLTGWNNDMINAKDSIGMKVLESGKFQGFWKFSRSGKHLVSVSFHSTHDSSFAETAGAQGSIVNLTPLEVNVVDLDTMDFGPQSL